MNQEFIHEMRIKITALIEEYQSHIEQLNETDPFSSDEQSTRDVYISQSDEAQVADAHDRTAAQREALENQLARTKRASSIGSLHTSHVPYVPLSIRSKALLVRAS